MIELCSPSDTGACLSQKKVRERAIPGRFRAACSDFPPGGVEDSEAPDFLVRSGDHTVGIELVDYVAGQAEQGSTELMQEKLRAQVVSAAQKRYEALGGPYTPLHKGFRLLEARH